MGGIFGGSNKAADLQKQQAEAQQRQTLANLAAQQAETDQAAAGKTGRKTGSRMLTFLTDTTSGNSKFGQA